MRSNNFDDVLLFIGLALVAHSLTLIIIPLIMALNFVYFIIPSLDRYLENKYGEEFKEYTKKTKKFISWLL